ncbi:MAG: thioredoxin domain-containing protein [Candidatus Moranbacteria bacterium]|nr:thioredoxin domain-containing protein [Candidatus Moranbacteria bacterium]
MDSKNKNKTNQTLMAAAIILGGLFIGSLFVDVAQLISGQGISVSKLQSIEEDGAFETKEGKTWVLKDEPIVSAKVVTDLDCKECQEEQDQILLALKKSVFPTLVVDKIDQKSEQGEQLIEELDLKKLPAYLFEQDVENTDFFEQGKVIFNQVDENYVLDNSKAGIPVNKYLVLPEFQEDVEVLGNPEADTEILIFGDFQCPYSKMFADNFSKVIDSYKDTVKVSFYQFPLTSIHPQAFDASHASLCANEQGKFWEMHDKLFASQSQWGVKDAKEGIFTDLAVEIGLNSYEFNQCMQEQRYNQIIQGDLAVAEEFGIAGTPSVFIGDRYIQSAVGTERIKEMIEDQL